MSCQFPHCTKKVWVEKSGRQHDYCGRTHANMHREALRSSLSHNVSAASSHPSQQQRLPPSRPPALVVDSNYYCISSNNAIDDDANDDALLAAAIAQSLEDAESKEAHEKAKKMVADTASFPHMRVEKVEKIIFMPQNSKNNSNNNDDEGDASDAALLAAAIAHSLEEATMMEKGPRVKVEKIENEETNAATWACTECTFVNVNTALVCDACETEKIDLLPSLRPGGHKRGRDWSPSPSEKSPNRGINMKMDLPAFPAPGSASAAASNTTTASSSGYGAGESHKRRAEAALGAAMKLELYAAARTSLLQNQAEEQKKVEMFWRKANENQRKLEAFYHEEDLAAAEAAKIWQCENCSTDNAIESAICTQCAEPRIVVLKKVLSCATCTFDNLAGVTQCFSCGTKVAACLNESGPAPHCGIPGCGLSGAVHFGFCSKQHWEKAFERQIMPPGEKDVEVVFCGNSGDYTASLLRPSHPKHLNVKTKFLDTWQKTSSGNPTVERIFLIRVRLEIKDKFEAAKKRLGNVKRCFHGTSQDNDCQFGTNPGKPPCDSKTCRVCRICRYSFDLSQASRGPGGTAWAHKTQRLRYNEGIYFSPVSSKSNDYNGGSERERLSRFQKRRKWRCMFLCNVALGQPFHTKEGFLPKEQCPPPNYDSVVGETGGTGLSALNYEECCVYNEDQAIPAYLIVYSLHAQ